MRAYSRNWRPALILVATLLLCTMGLGHLLTAHASESVTGLVVSNNRVLLEGAVVSIDGVGSVTTDAAGRFAFPDVPPGNYRMTVSKQGFPDDKRLIFVQADRLNKILIVLAGAAPRLSDATAVGVPILQQGGSIFVRGRVNDQIDTVFLIDTGATFCVLTRATADRLGLVPDLASTIVTLHTASGTIEAPLMQLDVIQVGAAEVRSVQTVVHDVPGLPAGAGGLLGMSFLDQFKVEIDQEHGVMLLSR